MVDEALMLEELKAHTSGGGTHGLYQDVGAFRGHRNMAERFDLFNLTLSDLAGKSILDLGCNLGGIVGHYAAITRFALGLDIDPVFIKWAQRLYPYAMYWTRDLDLVQPRDLVQANGGARFDIVFALAIWDYVNQERFIQLLRAVTDGTLFFEGHEEDPPMTLEGSIAKYYEILQRIGATHIQYLGTVHRGRRPVFRGVLRPE